MSAPASHRRSSRGHEMTSTPIAVPDFPPLMGWHDTPSLIARSLVITLPVLPPYQYFDRPCP